MELEEEMDINDGVEIEEEDTSSGDDLIIQPFNPNDIEIETPPYTVGYLMDNIEHNEINMNTDFQRSGNLWTDDKQSRLIESLLLGLPLPAFYFDTSNSTWDIIDGLQRCCSIQNFCVKKTLRLRGLEFLGYRNGKPFLNGKTFDELDRTLQRSIITRPITINKIKKADKNVRYILFKRLNTGGLELTSAEIRNAVYQGVAAETLKELAEMQTFKDVTLNRISGKRMEDRDFVSRFVSFYLVDFSNYEPGLDDFINKSMETLVKSNGEKLKHDFKSALLLSWDIFGDDAFRKRFKVNDRRKPINKAYFEVITVLFSKLNEEEISNLKRNRKLLKSNLITLMNNYRYSNSLSGGTGTKDSVNIRFSWFKQVLDRTIKGNKIVVTDDNKIENREF